LSKRGNLLNILGLKIDGKGKIVCIKSLKKFDVTKKPRQKELRSLINFFYFLQEHRISHKECSQEALYFLCQYYLMAKEKVGMESSSLRAISIAKTLYILSR